MRPHAAGDCKRRVLAPGGPAVGQGAIPGGQVGAIKGKARAGGGRHACPRRGRSACGVGRSCQAGRRVLVLFHTNPKHESATACKSNTAARHASESKSTPCHNSTAAAAKSNKRQQVQCEAAVCSDKRQERQPQRSAVLPSSKDYEVLRGRQNHRGHEEKQMGGANCEASAEKVDGA
jgi:hypothetical protein